MFVEVFQINLNATELKCRLYITSISKSMIKRRCETDGSFVWDAAALNGQVDKLVGQFSLNIPSIVAATVMRPS